MEENPAKAGWLLQISVFLHLKLGGEKRVATLRGPHEMEIESCIGM
jgi:hypothetical protein